MTTQATVVLRVRVSPGERLLLEAAAAEACMSLSDFVRRKAIEAAECDLLDRRIVTIPARDWEPFEAWTEAPAQDIAALRRLAETPPVWRY